MPASKEEPKKQEPTESEETPIIKIAKKTSPATTNQDAAKTTIMAPPYDSNPFTTTIAGIKHLFAVNTSALIGSTLLTVVLSGIVAIVLLVMIVAGLGYVAQHPEVFTDIFPVYKELANEAFPIAPMSDASVYSTWLIGVIAILAISAIGQGIQIKLATESAASHRSHVGELFKTALKRAPALIALGFLGMLAMLATGLVFGILAPVLGLATFILGVLAAVFAIYAIIRLLYVPFAIVSEELGPIKAISYSWRITNGHVVETIGVAAVTFLLVVVPTSLLDAASRNVEGPVGAMLGLIAMLVSIVVGMIAIMGLAFRFTQLKAIANGTLTPLPTHVSNYLAILALIVAMPLVTALAPPVPKDKDLFYPKDLEQRLNDPRQYDNDLPDRYY